MTRINLCNESGYGYTAVPNIFIDAYMKEANDAQLKVYLYLVRKLAENNSFSISEIADEFNHTEKDVLRSLNYWEEKALLSIKYDADKNITGIALTTPSLNKVNEIKEAEAKIKENTPLAEIVPVEFPCDNVPTVPKKPAYGADDIRNFKEMDDTSDLLLITSQYLKKNLSISDVKTLMYIYKELHFSVDMIDVLLQYCVQKGKLEFRYIEKVACGWFEQGITTPAQAKEGIDVYDANIYSIMKALGKTGNPTSKEIDFINKWVGTYNLSMDMIYEGCEKAAMTVDTHRFEYADGIFTNWRNNNLITLEDVDRHETEYKKNRADSKLSKNAKPVNQFTNYKQNKYDYAALEKDIISN